jgi:CRISPR system Cascade subunit CasD
MHAYLILKLDGPLQSWGTHTYEDFRPSSLFPTHSGILGLLGACLGIERHNHARLLLLRKSIEIAVRADHVLRDKERLVPIRITDFHTIQEARKVDGKANKYPVVSRREYLCDAKFTVAIRETADPAIDLDVLEEAVKHPFYTPFLGRRACALGRPLWEARVKADSFEAALQQIEPGRGVIYGEAIKLEHSRLQMRDIPLSGTRRQFVTRMVNIKVQGE